MGAGEVVVGMVAFSGSAGKRSLSLRRPNGFATPASAVLVDNARRNGMCPFAGVGSVAATAGGALLSIGRGEKLNVVGEGKTEVLAIRLRLFELARSAVGCNSGSTGLMTACAGAAVGCSPAGVGTGAGCARVFRIGTGCVGGATATGAAAGETISAAGLVAALCIVELLLRVCRGCGAGSGTANGA